MLRPHPRHELPVGNVAAGKPLEVVVGSTPSHPIDVLEIILRRNGMPPQTLRAQRTGSLGGHPVQWFRAVLPPLGEGEQLDYRVELSRSGRVVACHPGSGDWLGVVGTRSTERPSGDAPIPDGMVGRQRRSPPSSAARFPHELEFFAALTANLRPEFIGRTPEGLRANFFIEDGTVVGPRISATILRDGGDWMIIRPDGIGMLDVTITYRTSDGVLILEKAAGLIDFGPEGYSRIAAGDLSGSAPFYATPVWSTADPNWKWLNRHQGYGFGWVDLKSLRAETDLYLPRVGERFARV